jgi:hypothetical protein
LDQRRQHHADAQEVAQVGEVNVEIPAEHIDVIKDAPRCHQANQTQGAIDGLVDQLYRSVFNHGSISFILRL